MIIGRKRFAQEILTGNAFKGTRCTWYISAIFTRTLVKGIYSKRKEFAPGGGRVCGGWGANYLFGIDPFSQGRQTNSFDRSCLPENIFILCNFYYYLSSLKVEGILAYIRTALDRSICLYAQLNQIIRRSVDGN